MHKIWELKPAQGEEIHPTTVAAFAAPPHESKDGGGPTGRE